MKYVRKIANRITAKVAAKSAELTRQDFMRIENDIRTLALEIHQVRLKQTNNGLLYADKNEVIVKLFNGLKIYLDTRDISLTPHVALDGIWEQSITTAWIKLLKPKNVTFDIGANFGYFGLLAAHVGDKKSSKVVFFEPNPKLIPYINKTLALNWYIENSSVENMAVSEKSGKAELTILKDYLASSSLQSSEKLEEYLGEKMALEVDETVVVDAISIDEYCSRNDIKSIDLIKIDIEGHEDKAYAGMKKIVKSSPDLTMFIEFTKEGYKNPENFYNQLLNDFSSLYLIDENGKFYKPTHNSYSEVVSKEDDWVMLVLSKNDTLQNL